jgi:hypothetical protein
MTYGERYPIDSIMAVAKSNVACHTRLSGFDSRQWVCCSIKSEKGTIDLLRKTVTTGLCTSMLERLMSDGMPDERPRGLMRVDASY